MARDFDSLFRSFSGVPIGVIGDVMLDTYWWGHVDRISPEAPVPVVTLDRREYRVGGAANVALNLAALGASVTSFAAIGSDPDGEKLTGLLDAHGIRTERLLRTPSRITTNKTRVISRNQQMIRIDGETTDPLKPEEEDRLLDAVRAYLREARPVAMVFEDYNKGVLTEKLIAGTVAACREAGVLTAVDPKRKHFFSYRGVDIFKPNLKEVREALNLLPEEADLPVLDGIDGALREKLDHTISFITLSENGVFYHDRQRGAIVPSHLRRIADVSGAGDTVIAVATLVYALTRDIRLMAEMANLAGGLVCESVGTVPVEPARFLKECKRLLPE